MTSSSIAILMLVHENERQVQRLINHFKTDFDIFVHVDKKSNLHIKSEENVRVFSEYEVYWGAFTQILATLSLLREACKNRYQRYIFISGKDLPLVQNPQIIHFFKDDTKDYIEFEKLPRTVWQKRYNGGHDRLLYYWGYRWHFSGFVFDVFRLIQKILGFRRKVLVDLWGGSQWFNLTNQSVKYLLEYVDSHPEYLDMFKNSECGDEIFFQTILCNPDLKINLVNDSLRYIDWSEGKIHPKTNTMEDLDRVISSGRLFGRKFDENIDSTLMDKIYQKIKD